MARKRLRLITEFVFGLPEEKIRLEGHTRQDNLGNAENIRTRWVCEGSPFA